MVAPNAASKVPSSWYLASIRGPPWHEAIAIEFKRWRSVAKVCPVVQLKFQDPKIEVLYHCTL